jgi:predicted transcriptional regulator
MITFRKENRMEDTFVIENVEQLKVFADPLRQKLLQCFCCNPATTKQAASMLGEKPTRLYHHVEQLENAGLIEIVETKQNRGTVEKYYQTVASKFVVDHALTEQVGAEAENISDIQTTLVNTLQAGLADARQYFSPGEKKEGEERAIPILGTQVEAHLTSTKAIEFVKRLCDLVQEYSQEQEQEDAQSFSITVAVFPINKEISMD